METSGSSTPIESLNDWLDQQTPQFLTNLWNAVQSFQNGNTEGFRIGGVAKHPTVISQSSAGTVGSGSGHSGSSTPNL